MPGVVPDIPGERIINREQKGHLVEHLSNLCGLNGSHKFPGSQPVSFTAESLNLLESMNFWVCEKSDGVRLLIFVVHNGTNQEVFLIDRKNEFYAIEGLWFPHWEDPNQVLSNTVIDGELVIDEDPSTHEQHLRFYGFDCLVIQGENLMQKNLKSRYGRLQSWVIGPFNKQLQRQPELRDHLPFDLIAKKQELSYHIKAVLENHIPSLQHGHDGLIFTCEESAYVAGTDEKILKWKPANENSIDFQLQLRFPPGRRNESRPDYTATPTGLLNTWCGGVEYEFFDTIEFAEEEWEQMKESGEQWDDRLVECAWDAERGTWKILRFRDDKQHANHKSIMQKILVSIEEGVEIETVLSRTETMRSNWKAREARAAGGAGPAPGQAARRPTVQTGGIGARPAGAPVTPGAQSAVTPGGFGSAPVGVMAGLKR